MKKLMIALALLVGCSEPTPEPVIENNIVRAVVVDDESGEGLVALGRQFPELECVEVGRGLIAHSGRYLVYYDCTEGARALP